MDAMLKKNARELTDILTDDYSQAVKTEVAEGKLTETEAIEKIQEHDAMTQKSWINLVRELREDGFITDRDAKIRVETVLNGIAKQDQIEEAAVEQKDIAGIDQFFTEEEEK